MRVRLLLANIFLCLFVLAQKPAYTHADTVKGTYSAARSWWDALHYDLHVNFSIPDSSISGRNVITYKVLDPGKVLQLDLMEPMILDSVLLEGRMLNWVKDGNAYFISIPEPGKAGEALKMTTYFHGKPRRAKMPPWDGGVIWARDKSGNPWISIACQGMAAQVWFPNKDHPRDEPDSVMISITAPKELVTVSNGRLQGIDTSGNLATYRWRVFSPINNYCIIPYTGKYASFHDTLNGRGGVLDLDYWVLRPNLETARKHFAQVKPMLRCFEEWFGPYPFYRDGYKLVEAPFLGMEHQGAIAYGNDYVNGYKGRDLSNTGWGANWDFIIVHESGHEWFGNNVTAADVADNWVHEGFTAYAENLYVEYLYGKKAGADYVIGTRASIQNDKPIIADYNVNAGGSLDLYFKAANMLHMIRQMVKNDSVWKAMLRGINREFRYKTVTTQQIEAYMITFLKIDLQNVFDQYLRTTRIPILEYSIRKGRLRYRWTNCIKGFNMQIELQTAQGPVSLRPSEKWQSTSFSDNSLLIDRNYYVGSKKVE
jgi:aminopeptidase N